MSLRLTNTNERHAKPSQPNALALGYVSCVGMTFNRAISAFHRSPVHEVSDTSCTGHVLHRHVLGFAAKPDFHFYVAHPSETAPSPLCQ